jgi:hypothetical protein
MSETSVDDRQSITRIDILTEKLIYTEYERLLRKLSLKEAN